MKWSTGLELIVLVLVILGMIYLVEPDPVPMTTETAVAAQVAPPAPPESVPKNGSVAAAPPTAPAPVAPVPPAPPKPATVAANLGLVDIGLGCLTVGAAAGALALVAGPSPIAALFAGGGSAPAASSNLALGAALAVGCAAGAMAVPTIGALLGRTEVDPGDFSVAVDRASASLEHAGRTLGLGGSSWKGGLLYPDERPNVISIGSFNMPGVPGPTNP